MQVPQSVQKSSMGHRRLIFDILIHLMIKANFNDILLRILTGYLTSSKNLIDHSSVLYRS